MIQLNIIYYVYSIFFLKLLNGKFFNTTMILLNYRNNIIERLSNVLIPITIINV